MLAFEFSVNRENKTITVKREFSAALPDVWDAFTKKEILDQWWAPKPWKSRTRHMEFKEGGIRNYAMVGPEGEEHWSMFNYQTIEPQKRFTGIDGFTDAHGVLNTEMPRMFWDVRFIDEKDRTLVDILITVDDLSHLDTIIKMGFKGGFTMTLQALEELLAARKKA